MARRMHGKREDRRDGLALLRVRELTESQLDFLSVVGNSSNGIFWPYDKQYSPAFRFAGESALNQKLRHVIAEVDTTIAFPSIYQHLVNAFELADPTKSG
ncbi:hypothetical protein TRAPUB_3380, partial [Trametes pubescens]